MINYISTRGGIAPQKFTQTLLDGMAADGGLYVPETWPTLSADDLRSMAGLPYYEIARQVITPFLDDSFSDAVISRILQETYGRHFNHACVAPLVQISPNLWVMELFHGPTLAFKDYALQVLGRLFDYILEQKKQRVTIVGATSGDTGSAAIEACKGCKNIDIFILHPQGRTSEVQRRQMTTVNESNVFNIAVKGTFDDCQNMVKAMFADKKFSNDISMSAVNSINWARIMTQVVYYVAAAIALGTPSRKISFAVPTGNFGNIYAAYAAKCMGLPIKRLVIGSNRNDILTRFFETGTMKAQQVEPSLSPSMDIQISSNFERYMYDLLDHDGKSLTKLMDSFKKSGVFSLGPKYLDKAREEFDSYRCSDSNTSMIMKACYKETGYVLDPHTAVGLYAGMQVREDPSLPMVALACAHPAKFPDAVEAAIGTRPVLPEHLQDLYARKEIFTVLDNDLTKVKNFIQSHRNK